MRGLLIASSVLAAGCFDPTPPAGSPCGEEGACPAGQRCDPTDRCVLESSSEVDAAEDGGIDSLEIDAPPAGPVLVSFQTPSSMDTEATGTVEITVNLSAPAPMPLTASITVTGGSATTPSDFTVSQSTTISFPAGATSQTFMVQVVSDPIDEDDETVNLALAEGTGTVLGPTTSHTLTISDDDAPPTVSWDPAEMNTSAPEGGAGVTTPYMWRVVLSAPSSRAITVPVTFTGNAASPSDYSVTTGDVPVAFAAGTSSKLVRVTVNGDAAAGGNEDIIMTLGAPTNATLGAITMRTHTLVNDD